MRKTRKNEDRPFKVNILTPLITEKSEGNSYLDFSQLFVADAL